MKHCFCLLLLFVLFSCKTIDVEKNVSTSRGQKDSPALVIPIDTDPIIVEKPVYVPSSSTPAPAAQGRNAVAASNRDGILQPSEYEKAVMVYDYHKDFVYQIYCQPLRVTDITLQPGEQIVDLPFISDSERWMVGAGFHYESNITIQHVYIKPTAANLRATLIINTNTRVYRLILMSYSDIHMPAVRFRYWENSLPQSYAPTTGPGLLVTFGDDETTIYADPRYLSFNYRIRYGLLSKKPRWLPALVYDDGKKTYIIFPDTVLQNEMPAVFEDRADIINYRVSRNIMVIDKLVEKISVKLGKQTVIIEKKRGRS